MASVLEFVWAVCSEESGQAEIKSKLQVHWSMYGWFAQQRAQAESKSNCKSIGIKPPMCIPIDLQFALALSGELGGGLSQ